MVALGKAWVGRPQTNAADAIPENRNAFRARAGALDTVSSVLPLFQASMPKLKVDHSIDHGVHGDGPGVCQKKVPRHVGPYETNFMGAVQIPDENCVLGPSPSIYARKEG